jgi:hypothetical protein
MSKKLTLLLSLFLLSCAYQGIAQCNTWQSVGNVDDTNQPSFGRGAFQAIAFNNGNSQPYVIYEDAEVGGKATVVTQKSGKWIYAGPEGFSPGMVQYTTIQVGQSSNKVYAAFQDGNFSGSPVVMVLNGLSWIPLGGPPAYSGQAQYI